MNHKLSVFMCQKLLKYKAIDEELSEIYIYGFELIFSFLISTTAILTIGIVLNQVIPTLIFLVFFILIRRYTGGYHANTYLKCQIYTISSYIFVISASLFLPVFDLFFLILMLAGIITIIAIGPIENPHKQLTEQEKRKHKKTGLFLFSAAGVIGYTANYFHSNLSNTIFYTLFLIIVLMVIPYISNKYFHRT